MIIRSVKKKKKKGDVAQKINFPSKIVNYFMKDRHLKVVEKNTRISIICN